MNADAMHAAFAFLLMHIRAALAAMTTQYLIRAQTQLLKGDGFLQLIKDVGLLYIDGQQRPARL